MARGKEIVGTGLFIVFAIVLLFALPIIIAYLLVIIFPAYVGVYWYIVVLILLLMIAFGGARISVSNRTRTR